MKFWITSQFKELQAQWYERIKETGFVDIEKSELLKQNAPNSYRQAAKIVRDAKLLYHLLLSAKLEEHKCDNDIDTFVMMALSQGLTFMKISGELKKRGHNTHRETIRFIRRKYEHRWGIRVWKTHQLTKNFKRNEIIKRKRTR